MTTDEARLVVKGQRCGESGRGDSFFVFSHKCFKKKFGKCNFVKNVMYV